MKRGMALVLSMLLAGCGSSGKDDCEPGEHRDCSCSATEQGFQLCQEDGSGWKACDCECTPDCANMECGIEPVCGTSCGECGDEETCNALGQCIGSCVPECTGLDCGPDPVCGLSCGECGTDERCTDGGQCISTGDLTISGWTSLPHSEVAAAVGRPLYTTTADAEGYYELTVPTYGTEFMVTLLAYGDASAGQDFAALASLLGDLATVQELAGSDMVLTRDEHPGVNISPVTTARYAAMVAATGTNWDPYNREEFVEAEQEINSLIGEVEMVQFAGAIDLILHSPSYSLPAGYNNTLELARDPAGLRAFVEQATLDDPAEDPCLDAAATLLLIDSVAGSFDHDDLPSSYYEAFRHRNNLVGGAMSRYDFNSGGRGVMQPFITMEMPTLFSFDWAVENGRLRITFDEGPEDLPFMSTAEIVELFPDEPAIQQQIWDALGPDEVIEVREVTTGMDFLMIIQGETVDYAWPTANLMVYLAEPLAQYGLNVPDVTGTRLEPPRALFRHEGLAFTPFTTDTVLGTWAMQLVLPLNMDMTYSDAELGDEVATHVLVEFDSDGTASATGSMIAGTLDMTWEILDGLLRLTYPDGQVLTVGQWYQAETETGFFWWYRPVGDVVYSEYWRAARFDSVIDFSSADLLNTSGSYWQTTINYSSYLPDSQGQLPLDSIWGLCFQPGSLLDRLYVDYYDYELMQDPYVYYEERWVHDIGTSKVLMELRQGPEQISRCDDADPSCVTWRARRWTAATRHGDLLYVLEEEDWAADWLEWLVEIIVWDPVAGGYFHPDGTYEDFSDRAWFIPQRLNAYSLEDIPTFP